MKRREFINSSVKAGLLGGTALSLGKFSSLFPASLIWSETPFRSTDNTLFNTDYQLAAIKGAEPETMFDEAIKAFGGMKKFVKPGHTVVVKPNIGWDTSPERAGCTNPKLVNRIIKHCFDAGAKKVYVFDHTCEYWKNCYSNSGIESAAKDAKAKVVSGENESYYQDVSIKQSKKLKNAKVHELILESDVFINVPILKNHGSTDITVGMKNMMGVIWDRGYWHANDLDQCIADFSTYRKPDLIVVDAYNVMRRNGPRGVSKDDLVQMKSLLMSTDVVAADAAAAKLFGKNPSDIAHIKIADAMKIGTMQLDGLPIYKKIF